jgi:hypothetical protein
MKKIRVIGIALILAALTVAPAQAANIEVSGVQKYVGGANTAVPAGGTSDNFTNTTTVGNYAVFDMKKNGVDFADLRVTYQSSSGNVGSSVMIAQTTNSQGLVDNGTISILLNVTSGTGGGASFTFDWFAPGSFANGIQLGSSLISDAILYTTFDIDFYQFVATPTNQLQYYALNNNNTLLKADLTETPGQIRFEDNNANSSYSDPRTAAQFLTLIGPASHQIDMGKQIAAGNALFMFEFRDPSIVLGETFTPNVTNIPEPATASMIGLVGILGFLIRRHFCG